MIQNTFIVGGEPKFATKFIERLNKRFDGELDLKIHAHKHWDQSGDRRENIPAGTDLVLVMKSNVNHSLRNWARKKALDVGVKFIECCHKVAIAELDIRHCYNMVQGYDLANQEDEPLDLYETWNEFLGDMEFILPLWGMEDEGLFTGMDVYERMPWVHNGKKKMITKWDKIWLAASKSLNPEMSGIFRRIEAVEGKKASYTHFHNVNNGKSPYFKLIQVFKSFQKDTIGHSQLKLFADQWLRDGYLGTNFKDFTSKSNISYALNLIFGLSLQDLSDELQEIINEHFPKPGRPRKSKVKVVAQPETPTPVVCEDSTSQMVAQFKADLESNKDSGLVVEQPVVDVPKVDVEPLEESSDCYVRLGDLKIYLNDTAIILNEVHLTSGELNITIHGDIDVSIQRIEDSTLYGVKMKKKG
tara:strand:+ start:911 stop:2155 length:1245 start_codon:yes stop_codon:yes gene_type:complete